MSVSAFVTKIFRFFEISKRSFYGASGHFQVRSYCVNGREARAFFIGSVTQIHIHRDCAVWKISGIDFTVIKQSITPQIVDFPTDFLSCRVLVSCGGSQLSAYARCGASAHADCGCNRRRSVCRMRTAWI